MKTHFVTALFGLSLPEDTAWSLLDKLSLNVFVEFSQNKHLKLQSNKTHSRLSQGPR